jgi:hypothetical protein
LADGRSVAQADAPASPTVVAAADGRPPIPPGAGDEGGVRPADAAVGPPAVESADPGAGQSPWALLSHELAAPAAAPTSSWLPEPAAAPPAPAIDDASGEPAAPTPQEAIAGLARHISSAMDALVEQVKSLPDGIEGVSSLVRHAADIGDIAGRMVDEMSATALNGVEQLSEILGGPPADLGGSPVVQDLPAAILGAAADALAPPALGGAALPALDVVPLAPVPVPVPVPAAVAVPLPLHADLAAPAVDPVAAVVTELPPLQLGFLGQSYVDVADQHDSGPHTLSSPLYGFV